MKKGLLLFSLLLVIGCNKKAPPQAHAVAPEVTAVRVTPRNIPMVREYVGQIAGIRDIQVRARVGGILLKRYYIEGSPVKAGTVLFKIDPEPYKAAVDQARATVQVEQARTTNARQALNRILPLYKENAVSQKDRDDAVADFNSAKSSLAAAKAKLQEAQINLGYTTVVAPIDGYTSMETVSEGSLIVANSDKSLLTTISQINPAYVNFSYTESENLQAQSLAAAGKLSRPNMTKMEVQIRLGDGSFYPLIGTLNFNDNIVDTSTGTIKARAVINNDSGQLKPGQFVRVFLRGFTLLNAIAIPLRSVVSTQTGSIVFIVSPEGRAQQVAIETGTELGQEVVVNKGLRGGEMVIVDGAAKVRNGMPVKVVSRTSIAKRE